MANEILSRGAVDGHFDPIGMRCSASPTPRVLLLAGLLACLATGTPRSSEIPSPDGGSPLQITTWGGSAGLPSNSVCALAQTPDGYLWLGAETGLLRFDGARFVEVPTGPGSADAVAVSALLVARDGGLWVGTDGRGVVRMRGAQRWNASARDGIPGNRVRALAQDAEGSLWVGGGGEGVARVTGDRVERIAGRQGQVLGECSILCPDPSGGMWVGNSTGLSLFKEGAFHPLELPTPHPERFITCMYAGPGGDLWIGTKSGLLVKEGEEFRFLDKKDGLVSLNIYLLAPASGGDLWVGTYGGGLQRFRRGTATGFSTYGKLQDDRILCLCEDREGGIWVGTRAGGIACFRPGAFRSIGEREGLGAHMVYPVLEDRRGTLWAGTVGGGLARITPDGAVSRISGADGLGDDSVYALYEDSDGSLWAGLGDGTLTRTSEGGLARYTFQTPALSFRVSAIHRDAAGDLFVGTRGGGLWVQRGRRFERLRAPGEGDGLNVHQILEDPDGTLWVASTAGVFVLRENRLDLPWPAKSALRTDAFCLHRDAGGALWVGTYGQGLVRLKDGVATRTTLSQGLQENIVYKILEDPAGTFWMSGNRGISTIPRRELEALLEGRVARVAPKLFGAEEGLPTSECDGGSDPAGCILRSGELCFPTANGLVLFRPDHIRPNRVPPPIVVEEVLLNGKKVTADAGAVPQGRGNLEIRYTALSLANPGKVRFRYTLEGYDGGWVDAGARRTAYYTNLPAGDYRFRVAACNADGVWSPSDASLRLRLTAPFYRTPAFALLLAALLASSVWGAHVLRVRLYRKRSLELESRVAERTAQLVAQNERVEELEELYRAIVEDQVEMVCRYLPDGTLTFVNGSLARFVGRTAADLKGTALLEHLTDEEWPRVREHLAALTPRQAVGILMTTSRIQGQAARTLEWTTRAFFDEAGIPTGFQSVGRDITWRLRMEKSLLKSQRLEAMGQLAAGVAHDVNNLLQAMRGTAATVREAGASDPRLARAAEEIQVDIERCSKLARQLLLLGPRETPRPREMDLSAAVAEMEGLLRRVPHAEVQLQLDLASEPLPVVLDLGDLEQILLNLVINASESMPRGGRILLRTSTRGEDLVTLTVSDTGGGIAPATLPHIFEPFFTTREGDGGTGLGLAVVRGAAERHGGTVEVESQVGCGSAFKVTFPRATGEPGPHAEAEEAGAPPLRDLSILVVDDEPDVLGWLEEALEMLGWEVTTADSVAEAEAAMGRVHPRAVLSDFLLPDGSGADFLRRLRRDHPGTAAVLASGYTEGSLGDLGAHEGVRFLKKPFSLDDLERTLAEAMGGKVEP